MPFFLMTLAVPSVPHNVKFNSIADTMLMSYAFENGITRHNIDDLAFKHLNHTTFKFKDLFLFVVAYK